MDAELKEILDYHTKLLEQIVMSLDENRHRTKEQRESIGNMTSLILNNPLINSHPQAKEFVSTMANSLKNMGANS